MVYSCCADCLPEADRFGHLKTGNTVLIAVTPQHLESCLKHGIHSKGWGLDEWMKCLPKLVREA